MFLVGIPRALLFYQYFPMWKTFLEELGAEIVLSQLTTKKELSFGCSHMVAETCLPIKVFCGHVASLRNKCHYLFIPSIKSLERRVFNCPKFLGLPDMVRAVVPEAPPIIEADIDVNKGASALSQAIFKLARPFTTNPLKIKRALEKALQAQHHYQEAMWRKKLTVPQAINSQSYLFPTDISNGKENRASQNPSSLTIALVGHPYLLYDGLISHRLIPKLESLGAEVLVPEMVSPKDKIQAMEKIGEKFYWTLEGEVLGAAAYYLEHGVDGIIGATAFGCGPDSLSIDTIKRLARSRNIPCLHLTFDEHTAEAGLATRIEAFIDMLLRKRR